MPRRRTLVAGGIAVAAIGTVAVLRPRDAGQPHDGYFARLQQGLREAGIAAPTVVVDRDRLRRNLARIRQLAKLPLRVVVKSLPSMALVDLALSAWHTDRAMLFNGPQLLQVANGRPRAQVLLGKPLPAAAAQRVIAGVGGDALEHIQWLVDTPQRVQQYGELARAVQRPLKLNVEIDVGLHRGGVETTEMLMAMLSAIRNHPFLRWSGFMGYDAHVAAIPDLPGARSRAGELARERYAAMWDAASRGLTTPLARDVLTLNTGGSLTFHLHGRDGLPNEVAVGSAAVKPSEFDVASLAELEPAVFIATPVLKDLADFRLPEGVPLVASLARAWDPNQARAFAIHGGNWQADVVSPGGIAPSGLFGPSANQQVMVASAATGLRPDDFVFLRPRHSEAVLLQFGDIAMVEQGRVVAMAPVFPASA
jgi:D-serine deaminase-like pyridoxal phosphate-dependent protein